MSGRKQEENPVDIAIDILRTKEAEVWNDPDGNTHVSVATDGRAEHYRADSSGFRRFLGLAFFRATGKPIPREVLEHVINLLQAKAHNDGEVHEAYVRLGHHGDAVYLDLGDKDGTVVEIDAHGYRPIPAAKAPVRFVRPPGTRPLPRPAQAEDASALLELREMFRLSRSAFVLLIAFLVGCAVPERKYPLLVLRGGQGTGKSTLAEYARRLIDPRSVPLAAPPTNERDLVVTAMETFLIVYDNLSGLTAKLSDAFCRMSTGGGLLLRSLYTNRGVERFSRTAPVILNGIDEVAVRNDLADRAIEIRLRPLEPAERRPIREIDRLFDEAHPRLLGALCAAASTALANRDTVELNEQPRMLDFARWVKGAEPALPFQPGEFERAYRASRVLQAEESVEADPVAAAVVEYMDGKEEWTGSMTDLHRALSAIEPDLLRMSRRKLASELERAAPALHRVGFGVSRLDRKDERRRTLYRIRPTESIAARSE